MIRLLPLFTTTALLLGCVSALKVSPPFDPKTADDAATVPSIEVPRLLVREQQVESNLGFYACMEKDWRGYCYHLKVEERKCVNVDSSADNRISSFGPDKGTECNAYKDKNCHGDSKMFVFPGQADLNSGSALNDAISSYKCFKYDY